MNYMLNIDEKYKKLVTMKCFSCGNKPDSPEKYLYCKKCLDALLCINCLNQPKFQISGECPNCRIKTYFAFPNEYLIKIYKQNSNY